MKTVDEIKTNLAYAIGSESYTRHNTGAFVFTDGVNQLREDADAFWLVDAIASYQHKFKKVEFQVWELEVFADKTAVLTMKEDTNCPLLVEQKIHITNFPLDNIKFYVQLGSLDGYNPVFVLMLTSEY